MEDMQTYTVQNRSWEKLARKAFKIQQLRKKYEELEGSIIKELRAISQEQSSITKNFAFVRFIRRGPIDYSAIPFLKEIDLDQFRREEIPFWKLTKIERSI